MTLDELKAQIAAKFEQADIDLRTEQARRRAIVWQRLAEWGLTPHDGWTLEDYGWTVNLSHPPELPKPLSLLLSGDGKGNIYTDRQHAQVHNAHDVYMRLVNINTP